jgi:hypothetical protein
MSIADLWNAALAVFSTADVIRLVILAAVLIVSGFLMPSFGSILNATFLALVAFVVALYVRSLTAGGQDAMGLIKSDWNAFLTLDGKTLFVYALSFAVIITVVFFIRSIVSRG